MTTKGFISRRESKSQRSEGFTLVELLIVIVVLSTAGLLVLTIFTNSLRGSNKAQISSSIQKNGRNVLDTMDKTIRNSDNLVCISTPNHSTLVVVKDGIYTRYKFIPPAPVVNPTINGKIVIDNPVKDKNIIGLDPSTNDEYTDPAFKNKICAESDPDPSVALTDTDPETGVSITAPAGGIFSNPNPSAGFKNQVKIEFFVSQGVLASPLLTGQIDPVNFVTTVNLR